MPAEASAAPESDIWTPPQLGKLVKYKRHAAGLTQVQLAARAGVGIGVVRDLEQGVTSKPQAASVQRLVAALGIDDIDGPPGSTPRTWSPPIASVMRNGSYIPHAPLQVLVLGPLEVWRNSERVALGSPRLQAFLGLLALCAGIPASRDLIIATLWGQAPPPTTVTMIQSSVSRLRRLLAPAGDLQGLSGPLVRAGTGYALRLTHCQLDSALFGELCADARSLGEAGDLQAACSLYERALSFWRGDPLAGLDVLNGHPAIVALASKRAAAVTDQADIAARLGQHDLGLPHLRALTVDEPLNERAHACLMIALAATGRQAAALDVFEQMRHRLADELGISPGTELLQAHTRVLRQEISVSSSFRPDWRFQRRPELEDIAHRAGMDHA